MGSGRERGTGWLLSGYDSERLPAFSDCESCPALGPAALQDPAAALAAHAAQKAMGPGPAQITGLIGAFHSSYP